MGGTERHQIFVGGTQGKLKRRLRNGNDIVSHRQAAPLLSNATLRLVGSGVVLATLSAR